MSKRVSENTKNLELNEGKNPNFIPKNIPQKLKYDFLQENMLLNEEEAKSDKEILPRKEKINISRDPSKHFLNFKKPLKLSFTNFLIFAKNPTNVENISKGVSLQSNLDKKPSYLNLKNKKPTITSFEELDQNYELPFSYSPSFKKKRKIIQESDNKLQRIKSEIEIFEEFDKMKIYKFYFLHNNIEHIIAWMNSFLTRRKIVGINNRRTKKMMIKQIVKSKKIYPLRIEEEKSEK